MTRMTERVQPPENWWKGWPSGEWLIGAGGAEEPFLKDGEWWLRVWNRRTHEYGVYRFRTDVIERLL